MFGILQEFVRGKFSYHLCLEFYRNLLRGKFSYHLCLEFYRNLLEGSLVIIYASEHDVCCTRVKVRNGACKINFPLRTNV
jgi:hypothetical protein